MHVFHHLLFICMFFRLSISPLPSSKLQILTYYANLSSALHKLCAEDIHYANFVQKKPATQTLFLQILDV